jgi:DNA-binding transcriptional MerR regulator
MKNIETILSDAGIEVTDEQKTAIVKAMGDNYKPIADWQKQVDKVTNLTEQLTTTKDDLKKFDGVDADGLKKQIADLETKLSDKDKEYQTQIADRDFSEIVKDSIAKANGKNAKAIRALLDIDSLKASKNQSKDIEDAIKALSEAEDSKMLFGEPDPTVVSKTTPIGQVTKPGETLSGVEKAFLDRNPGLKLD